MEDISNVIFLTAKGPSELCNSAAFAVVWFRTDMPCTTFSSAVVGCFRTRSLRALFTLLESGWCVAKALSPANNMPPSSPLSTLLKAAFVDRRDPTTKTNQREVLSYFFLPIGREPRTALFPLHWRLHVPTNQQRIMAEKNRDAGGPNGWNKPNSGQQ